jgi:beta-lactamase regulating signal transducer with metallopeptidase domain
MGLTTMHWIESLSQAAATSAVSGIWQGLLLAAGVGLCFRLVPKTSAAIRFAVWTAVFVLIALLPFFHLSGRSHQSISAPGAVIHLDVRWSFAIAALWAVLSLVRAGKLAASAVRLRGLWKRSTLVERGAGVASWPSRVGSRPVQLCTSTEVDRPSVIGFFSPRILIPVSLFEKLSPAELEQIVLHEMGHLSRADDWINLFQKIGLVLFPLNPVLMWVERRLCYERELACDDGVLRFTKAPKAYASCLVSLAEHSLDHRGVSLSLGAWERQSELSRRVHSILRRGEGMTRLQARLVLSAIVLALLGGAAGLSRCRQFVSFSTSEPLLTARTEAQGLPAMGYQPVAFHPAAAPHLTLLKATLPSGQAPQLAKRTASLGRALRKQPARARVVQHAQNIPNGIQRWFVLTSWDETSSDGFGRSGMMLTVTNEHAPSRYAAVPTDRGWFVIQL